MFILNNIHDRSYQDVYPEINDVIFDISEKQLSNIKNSSWNEISKGSIVCVVKNTRKLSTIFRVISKYSLNDSDPQYGESHVLIGEAVAKLEKDTDMEILFNKYNIENKYLPNNQFSIGFNVANLGSSLDQVLVKTKKGSSNIAQLKENA